MTQQRLWGLTATRLKEQDLIDEIIEEPLGGAHRDIELTAERIKQSLLTNLAESRQFSIEELLQRRYDYWMAKGRD